MGSAPEPCIVIKDDVVEIRRSFEGLHNGPTLAWLLNVVNDQGQIDSSELKYHTEEWQGRIGWFTVPRDKVHLGLLAQRVKELHLHVETKCTHADPPCPIHNVDTRWYDEEMFKRFDW